MSFPLVRRLYSLVSTSEIFYDEKKYITAVSLNTAPAAPTAVGCVLVATFRFLAGY